MARARARSWVSAPVDEVFAFFDDPRNLGRLMPPPVSIRLLSIEPDPPRPGSLLTFSYGLGRARREWIVRLVEREAGRRFRDETVSGPLARFDHTHGFRAGRRGTWITDEIEFQVGPGGPLGGALDAVVGMVMRATFVWRAVRQRQLLRG